MSGKEHNKLLSIFFFVQGGLQLFGGIIMVLIYGGLGVSMIAGSRREEEQAIGAIFLVVAVVVGALILAIAAFDLFTGWRLNKSHPSGRTLGIVASCLSLLGFPLGTALGIYGLWFFLGEHGKAYYSGNSGNISSPLPPPPNSWQ